MGSNDEGPFRDPRKPLHEVPPEIQALFDGMKGMLPRATISITIMVDEEGLAEVATVAKHVRERQEAQMKR